ncbi:MAG: hypothetical protein ACFB10_16360 [Salibacteraceae bacterium]
MTFEGTEGTEVDPRLAAEWTENFRIVNPEHIRASFFGTEKLLKILRQPAVVGIRIYYAQDQEGHRQLILVGTDKNQNDVLGTTITMGADGPPMNGKPNLLNGSRDAIPLV